MRKALGLLLAVVTLVALATPASGSTMPPSPVCKRHVRACTAGLRMPPQPAGGKVLPRVPTR